MKKVALIVAGGSGKRMGNEIPKQFIELKGKPILMHTIETFFNFSHDIETIIVLPEIQINGWKKICNKLDFTIPHFITEGGNTRFESVKNGLAMVSQEGIVFIHDGVRPFVSNATLTNCLNTAWEKGNAIPVIPVSESLRKVVDEKNKAVDRRLYRMVQTPQTFHSKIIKTAYLQDYNPLFTDDASVFESNGGIINLVPGNQENIKITYPEDLAIAKILLSK